MNQVFSVKMRDGVPLSTHVSTSASGGPAPVLVARTPYGKEGMAAWLSSLASAGYAVVVQDVRGRGASGGVFRFLSDELADAEDTGKWVLEQPFCDGSIGLLGVSYLGASATGIAAAFPGNVKAAVWVAPVLSGGSLFSRNGALRLHHNLPWTALGHPRFKELDWPALYRHLPLKDALRSVGMESSMWDSICAFAEGTSAPEDLSETYRSLQVPGLHFGGYWDFMFDASLFGWETASRPGGKPQALFVGPWSHNGMAGEITRNTYADYGPEASTLFGNRLLQWFDHHLRGRELPADLAASVSAYVPGKGWLRTGAASGSWTAASHMDLYLGDGTLDREAGKSGQRTYVYDPSDPVPTEGGALWEFPKARLNPGPAVVTSGGRGDVLVFEGHRLDESVTALGPAEVLLYVETDAPSTDFAAKLVDVDAGGTPRIVADSICRVSGQDAGPDGTISVRIPGIGHLFLAGHRIRLDITSSNFPKFDRNLNTGISDLISDKMKVAAQTVRFGGSAPSMLRLSVVE